MNKRILKRLFVLLFVAAVALYLLISRRIPLGLDLRGGVQIVLRVLTDDVLKAETEATLEALRQETLPALSPATAVTTEAGGIRVNGIPPSALEGKVPGWDVSAYDQSRIPSTNLRMGLQHKRTLREDATVQTMRVIENRLNGPGLNEIAIQRYGDPANHEIQIQVPGKSDPRHIQDLIQSTGLLEFRMVERGPFESAQAAAVSYGNAVPSDVEILPSREGSPGELFYAVQRRVSLSGRHLRTVTTASDRGLRPAVGFSFNNEGAARFSKLTQDNIGKQLAIVLDGIVQSAPLIEMRIENSGIIQGGTRGFTSDQVHDLILVLRSGALPARTEPAREQFVGPSLGEDSIRAGIAASAVALGTVSAFVVAYYRMAGVNAVVAMLLNLLILLGAMAYFQATLTLPGIAGIVLTIGVGIDSNVLIFERIREELRAGKTPTSAIAVGFRRVFRTLIDTHLAAMISAAILGMFSSGAVRGFAVTLAIGLLSNMFTSVFVSRTLMECGLRKETLSI
jgi:preprotein translocase subunit SecD